MRPEISLSEAVDFAPPSSPVRSPVKTLSPWGAATQIHPAGTPGRLRQRTKFLVRALVHPHLTRAWLARLVQPDLAPLWVAHPRLGTKLQRPYVHCEWRALERFAALMGHYDALPRLFAPEALTAIYDQGIRLIRLTNATSGRQIDVRLCYLDQFEKEGELTIAIDDVGTGLNLTGITFCLARRDDDRIAIIGGLQASPDPRTRGLIHDITKEMHGLRPKALALWCLQQLVSRWQVVQLQAVGDEHHIYRHWRKRREFTARYDEFWTESDGRRLPGGGWSLPLQLRQRSREELKPSRRKAHERRYAMLDNLRPNLIAAVAALAPGTSRSSVLALNFIYSSGEVTADLPSKKNRPLSEEAAASSGALAPVNHSF